MELKKLLSILATAYLVVAVPTPELFKRADIRPAECGPDSDKRAWPLQSIQGAFDALQTNGNKPKGDKPTAGTRPYPQQYGQGARPPTDPDVVAALDGIAGCETSLTGSGWKYFEFPITDPVFAGGAQGSQGPDRVIAISPSPGQGNPRTYTYCLSITHRGGSGPSDPSFRPCVNA